MLSRVCRLWEVDAKKWLPQTRQVADLARFARKLREARTTETPLARRANLHPDRTWSTRSSARDGVTRLRDLAEEILQEVYIRVWQRAGEYDPSSSSPITWLATIARNRALDEAKRKTMRSLEDCPELLQVPSDDNPLATHERHEDARRLTACIDRLEPDRKELVLLVYYYGMTREEIASRIDRPVATVKTRLRRSLAQIKDCLGQ
jgi:RNA polymerase sigma-70 factor, ECF subfamily